MGIRLFTFCMLVAAGALQVEFDPAAAGIEGESKLLANQTSKHHAAKKKKGNVTRVNKTKVKFTVGAHVANDTVQRELLAVIRASTRLDPLEAALGGVSMADMIDLIDALAAAVKEGGLQKKVKAAISDLGTHSAKFSQQAKERAEEFKIEAQQAYDQDFVTLLATYLNETLGLEEVYAAQSLLAKKKIFGYLPQAAKDKIMVISSSMHASNLSLPEVSFETFNSTPLDDICDKVTPLGNAIAEYRHNLTEVHEMLNSTSRVLPLLTEFLPDTPKDVVNVLDDMLNFAYTEVLVHERAIRDLTEISLPVILTRTGCEWSQARSRLNLGLFTMVAAVALGPFRGL